MNSLATRTAENTQKHEKKKRGAFGDRRRRHVIISVLLLLFSTTKESSSSSENERARGQSVASNSQKISSSSFRAFVSEPIRKGSFRYTFNVGDIIERDDDDAGPARPRDDFGKKKKKEKNEMYVSREREPPCA